MEAISLSDANCTAETSFYCHFPSSTDCAAEPEVGMCSAVTKNAITNEFPP